MRGARVQRDPREERDHRFTTPMYSSSSFSDQTKRENNLRMSGQRMGGPGGYGPESHPCHPAVNPAMDPNHQMHPQDPNYYNSPMGAGQPGQGTQYPPHASAPPGQYPNYPSEMHHMNNMVNMNYFSELILPVVLESRERVELG